MSLEQNAESQAMLQELDKRIFLLMSAQTIPPCSGFDDQREARQRTTWEQITHLSTRGSLSR